MDANQKNLPSKEELERLKIQSEINEIKRPLYKKVSFYAALLPMVVAITGLVFTINSGFFDVQLQSLELKKELLNERVKKLHADSVRLYNDINQMSNEFEKKYEFLQFQYTQKHDSLVRHYNSLKTNLESQVKLRDSKREKEKYTELYNRIINKKSITLTKTVNEAITESIDYLREGTNKSEFLKMLSNAGNQNKLNEEYKFVFNYVLYHGTQDSKWKEKLFDFANSMQRAHIGYFIVFSWKHWSEEEKFQNIKRLKNICDLRNQWGYDYLLNICDFNKDEYLLEKFGDIKLFADMVSFARTSIFINPTKTKNKYILNYLQKLAPVGYYCYLAKIFTEFPEDNELKLQYKSAHSRDIRRIKYASDYVTRVANRLQVPKDYNKTGWLEWIENNKELFDLWMSENSIYSLVNDKNLRDKMMVLIN